MSATVYYKERPSTEEAEVIWKLHAALANQPEPFLLIAGLFITRPRAVGANATPDLVVIGKNSVLVIEVKQGGPPIEVPPMDPWKYLNPNGPQDFASGDKGRPDKQVHRYRQAVVNWLLWDANRRSWLPRSMIEALDPENLKRLFAFGLVVFVPGFDRAGSDLAGVQLGVRVLGLGELPQAVIQHTDRSWEVSEEALDAIAEGLGVPAEVAPVTTDGGTTPIARDARRSGSYYAGFKEFEYDDQYRLEELEVLGKFLVQGEGVQVLAPPGMGKSSFLRLAAAHPERMNAPATDLFVTYIPPINAERLITGMTEQLKRVAASLGLAYKSSPAALAEDMFVDVAQQILLSKDLIVILLDEPSEDLDNAMLSMLAVLRNGVGGRIKYVLGLRRPWDHKRAGPIYELAYQKLWLRPVSGSEARSQAARRYSDLQPEVIARATDLSGGSQLQKLLCIIARTHREKLEDLDSLLTFEEIDAYFDELWEYFNDIERDALRSVCGGTESSQPPDVLIESGVVGADGTLFSPLFAEWLRLRHN